METLINKQGKLCLPNGEMLIAFYPAGDCDVVCWPFRKDRDRAILGLALFDAYECGEISSRDVTLPDGTNFNIDAENAKHGRLLKLRDYY